MKIKLLRPNQNISKGTLLPVRKLPSETEAVVYQVTDGPHLGLILKGSMSCFLVVEATYTEKEWNDLENHYLEELNNEREEKERAKELVHKLSRELAMKTEELYISRSAVFRLIDRLNDKKTTSIVIQKQTINVNAFNEFRKSEKEQL